MKTIDLNCDMGELKPGQMQIFDEKIMPYISSCNIACGFHSGSPEIMERTIQLAIKNGVAIGAHPSYNDHKNFGRLSISIEPEQLMAELKYQICALKGMAESHNQKLMHVKPHGALYNDLAKDRELSERFVGLIKSIDPNLKIFALAHSQLTEACKQEAMSCVNEGFADRRYEKLSQLRNRKFEDAVIYKPKEVLAQIHDFLNGKIRLYNKEIHAIKIDSLCLHSDTEGAVALSRTIHEYLKNNDVNIAAIT